MKRLILNADDFGLTNGVSAGIVAAIRHGLVCSTSAMVCMPEFVTNIQRWANPLKGRIGIHLQLTDGSSCADRSRVASLVTGCGEFRSLQRDWDAVNLDDVRQEWHAQIERIRRLGIEPTHVDTHHHVHRLPGIFQVYCEIAETYCLPARTLNLKMTDELSVRGIRCADYCELGWYGGTLRLESFIHHIKNAFAKCGNCGTVEFMCHPGFVTPKLREKSRYVGGREKELRMVCTRRVLTRQLKKMEIELVLPSVLKGS